MTDEKASQLRDLISLEPLTQPDQIKLGDLLLLSNGKELFCEKVKRIIPVCDGAEVVLNLRKNRYFNLSKYLSGTSWAKQVSIVRHGS